MRFSFGQMVPVILMAPVMMFARSVCGLMRNAVIQVEKPLIISKGGRTIA